MIDAAYDAMREFRTGAAFDALPALRCANVRSDGGRYRPGDGATWAGSPWHRDEQPSAEPGRGDEWRSAVKKEGRDAGN